MESTPRLHATIVHVLSQHRNWLDRRHLKTMAWMIVGLLQSRVISLTAWPPYVQSRAVYAQSLVRRFDRWLHNPRIDVHGLYGPLMQQAIADADPEPAMASKRQFQKQLRRFSALTCQDAAA